MFGKGASPKHLSEGHRFVQTRAFTLSFGKIGQACSRAARAAPRTRLSICSTSHGKARARRGQAAVPSEPPESPKTLQANKEQQARMLVSLNNKPSKPRSSLVHSLTKCLLRKCLLSKHFLLVCSSQMRSDSSSMERDGSRAMRETVRTFLGRCTTLRPIWKN